MTWTKKADAFCQHAFRKSVEMLADLPRVLIARAAYNRMWHIVDLASQEVGWLGTCRREGQDFLIEEVFLFKQEVSGSTCEISADGLAEAAQELLTSRPDGMEIVNRLCFWGHSHCNMGTKPSGQDDSQMETFKESGHPFFVRGILNKNGRMEFTIFMYELGMKIVDAEWGIYEPVDESVRTEIEAEIKAKISEKKYIYAPSPAFHSGYGYGEGYDWHREREVENSVSIAGFSPAGKKKWRKKGGKGGCYD